MYRSFYKIIDISDFNNENIYKADAFILSQGVAKTLFFTIDKYEKFFKHIEEKKIDLFVLVDKDTEEDLLLDLDYHYVKGFYLVNPTKKILKKSVLELRNIERKNKLYFESLKLFVDISNIETLPLLYYCIKNRRVNYLSLADLKRIDVSQYQNEARELCKMFHVFYVEEEMIITDANLIEEINAKNTPTIEKIQDSINFIEKVKNATERQKRYYLKEESLTHHWGIVEMGKRLGLIDKSPTIFFYRKRKKEKVLKHPIIVKNFYTVGEEIGNAVTHGVGALLSIAALVILMVVAKMPLEYVSYGIFALSSLLLYTMSTLYHSFVLGHSTKAIFQKIDHISIYLLISGTYTPFSLIAIGGSTGIWLCSFLWGASLIGIILNIIAFGKYRFIHIFLYVFLGWIAIFFLPQIYNHIGTNGLILLIGGGVMYTLGLIFYGWKSLKYAHMVWHLFTLFGSVLHFFAILLYV